MAHSPEAMGVSSRHVLDMLDRCEREIHHLNTFAVARDGETVARGAYAPFAADAKKNVASIAKSMVALAVGILVDEGRIDLERLVKDCFAGLFPAKYDARLDRMRIRHLLTMTASSAARSMVFSGVTGDWATHYLGLEVPHEPGTYFSYDTGASYMLSRLVSMVSGKNTLDFLTERVFGPMGLGGIEWLADPQGVTVGGWGLYLSSDDMTEIGKLLADYGKYRGKQLVPERWLREATGKKLETRDNPGLGGWPYGYGYQFWRGKGGDVFQCYGAFGQLILCSPEKRLSVAVTSGCTSEENTLLAQLIYDTVFAPAGDGPLPESAWAEELAERVANLRIPCVTGAARSGAERDRFGKRYRLAHNAGKYDELVVARTAPDAISLDVTIGGTPYAWRAGHGRWATNTFVMDSPLHTAHAFSYAWQDDDTLVVRQFMLNTPYDKIFRFVFAGDGVSFTVEHTVALVGQSSGVVTGSFA